MLNFLPYMLYRTYAQRNFSILHFSCPSQSITEIKHEYVWKSWWETGYREAFTVSCDRIQKGRQKKTWMLMDLDCELGPNEEVFL